VKSIQQLLGGEKWPAK